MIAAVLVAPPDFDAKACEAMLAQIVDSLNREHTLCVVEARSNYSRDDGGAALFIYISEIEEGWQNRAVAIANAMRESLNVVINARLVYDKRRAAATAHF